MLEYGQPLHAFDYDNFSRPQVLVRRAQQGETFVTLDDIERTLNEDVLLITDGARPVAIGGIMGGQESEVGAETGTVLLESAHFKSTVIRRGRKFLGLTSESQDRFERGADPNIVPIALDRAAALIARYAGGEILSGSVDCYPQPIQPLQLQLRPARVNQILATDLSSPEMIDILNSLELKVAPGKTLMVTVPTFRPDITREIDLVEEVARVYGYHRIPTRMAAGGELVTGRVASEQFTGRIRDVLLAQGYYEVVANSFVDPKLVGLLYPDRQCVEVLNPISEDLKWMRPDLITGLLAIVRRNLNHRVNAIKLFEIGATFAPVKDDLPSEESRIAVALSGGDAGENWTFHPGAFAFHDVKGAIESIAQLIDKPITCSPASTSVFADGQSFLIEMDGAAIGLCGKIDSPILEAMGIKQEVYAAEFEFEPILSHRRQAAHYQPLPKYPPAERDMAVIVAESILTANLLQDIRESGGDKLRQVTLFDIYRGRQIGAGKKSVAFRLVFQDESKTLTDEYIDNVYNKIARRLEELHGAELRAE
jgi:phenylalanyl-tRNA synthetase beta chain